MNDNNEIWDRGQKRFENFFKLILFILGLILLGFFTFKNL